MSGNRVQKLLLSEYCDFEDMVLIESPFAQTTKDGKGIRQVHMGLTPSKLVLATDVLPSVENGRVNYSPGIDPDIETFELIAIYPVECVNLSVYRRKRRQALKAHFCNNRILYFELGGFERRHMFWNLWCEKVKFLCPGDNGSSRSETSVATSTTGSSLYLVDKKVVARNGVRQLWCKFGPNFSMDGNLISDFVGNSSQNLTRKWTEKYLFMGNETRDDSFKYQAICYFPSTDQFIKRRKSKRTTVSKSQIPSLMEERDLQFGDSVHVNRFGSGIEEGCATGLFLSVDDYKIPSRYRLSLNSIPSYPSFTSHSDILDEVAENAVLLWEFYNFEERVKVKHRRRYGFSPKPWFVYGIGDVFIGPGDNFSIQAKRAVSDVALKTCNRRREIRLPLGKNRLVSTVSCISLTTRNKIGGNTYVNSTRKPFLYFWTPNYSYRPVTAKETYGEQRRHFQKIQTFLEARYCKGKRKNAGKRLFRRFKEKPAKETDDTEEDLMSPRKKRKHNFIYNMFSSKLDAASDTGYAKRPKESCLQHLKRMLEANDIISVWDFDSSTLAQQLTMIDRDLFLKISTSELEVVLSQRNSTNAPNINALIAFSYRISCLIANEILSDESERSRARLMARFINAANKCHRISNFQSCRTVLSGLQNPAIYRLRKTWAYVRKKHASKYQVFEFLCRLYRDPRMPSFQKTFFVLSQNSPFLPSIEHILANLFNKVPQYKIQTLKRPLSRQLSICSSKSSNVDKSKIISVGDTDNCANLFVRLFKIFNNSEAIKEACRPKGKKTQINRRKNVKFHGLYEYYKPLNCYEDNRKETLAEVTEFLEKCQIGAINYTFVINESVRSYLLKARYKEDHENFSSSLRVEPPPKLIKP